MEISTWTKNIAKFRVHSETDCRLISREPEGKVTLREITVVTERGNELQGTYQLLYEASSFVQKKHCSFIVLTTYVHMHGLSKERERLQHRKYVGMFRYGRVMHCAPARKFPLRDKVSSACRRIYCRTTYFDDYGFKSGLTQAMSQVIARRASRRPFSFIYLYLPIPTYRNS